MTILKYFFLCYLLTALLKWSYFTLQIFYGNKLKKILVKHSKNRSQTNQTYSLIKAYCKVVKIKALPNPYGVSDRLINKSNPRIQSQLIDSLDESIGIYRSKRLFCYVLFSIYNNSTLIAILKFIFDAVIKVAIVAIPELIK